MSSTVSGWTWREHVERFLGLLSLYAGYDFDGTDWETIEAGIADTDDEDPEGWYGYPIVGAEHRLEVRLANAVGGDEISVQVLGVSDPGLRLRTDTLIAAFSA